MSTTNVNCSACGKPDSGNIANGCQCTVGSLRHRLSISEKKLEQEQARLDWVEKNMKAALEKYQFSEFPRTGPRLFQMRPDQSLREAIDAARGAR